VSWQGYSRRIQDARIRTNMDAGPPKMRARYTAVITEHDIPVPFFTKAQWSTLEAFYKTTLANGTLPFDWTDPVTGSSVSFRFLEPPKFSLLGPDTVSVTLPVEVLP